MANKKEYAAFQRRKRRIMNRKASRYKPTHSMLRCYSVTMLQRYIVIVIRTTEGEGSRVHPRVCIRDPSFRYTSL